MPSATAAAGLVDGPAGVRTAVRTTRRPAASSPAAMGRPDAAEVGRRRPALGLGRNLTAAQVNSQLANPTQNLRERIAGSQTTTKAWLQAAQVQQHRVAQPVIAPVRKLVHDLVVGALPNRATGRDQSTP